MRNVLLAILVVLLVSSASTTADAAAIRTVNISPDTPISGTESTVLSTQDVTEPAAPVWVDQQNGWRMAWVKQSTRIVLTSISASGQPSGQTTTAVTMPTGQVASGLRTAYNAAASEILLVS